MPNEERDYTEMCNALAPFGFEMVRPGIFRHEQFNFDFDFSTIVLENVMSKVWNTAFNHGYGKCGQDIKSILDIEC